MRGIFRVGVIRIAGPRGQDLHFGMGADSGNEPMLVPGFLSQCSGIIPEQFRSVRTCGSRDVRLSKLDREPKIREAVLLNSWDGFLVTLASISSKTSVSYSSVTPATNGSVTGCS